MLCLASTTTTASHPTLFGDLEMVLLAVLNLRLVMEHNLLQSNFHIKVLNPSNKRDSKMHTLRNILQEDLDPPSKIKDMIFAQCGK